MTNRNFNWSRTESYRKQCTVTASHPRQLPRESDDRKEVKLMHDEQEKKVYTVPELVEYGTVIKLTGG